MFYNAKAKSRFNGSLLTVKERFNANYLLRRSKTRNRKSFKYRQCIDGNKLNRRL